MSETPDYKRLTPKELRGKLLAEADIVLIDVLPPDHHALCRIPGSLGACVYDVTFPALVQAVGARPDKPVAVYGFGPEGLESVVAADKLRALGYADVCVLDGGLTGWIAAGYPVEGAAPEEGPSPELRLEHRRYELDAGQSGIEWLGRNAGNRHVGSLPLAGGWLEVSADGLAGSFEFDLRGIANYNLEDADLRGILIAHLLSEDFLDADRHPLARLVIESSRLLADAAPGEPNAEVRALLTLRGVTGELTFPATLTRKADGGLAVEAHLDFDRTRWGLLYGSGRHFGRLGMHLVYRDISVLARLTLY